MLLNACTMIEFRKYRIAISRWMKFFSLRDTENLCTFARNSKKSAMSFTFLALVFSWIGFSATGVRTPPAL